MPISRTGFIGTVTGGVTISDAVLVQYFGEVSAPVSSETVIVSVTVTPTRIWRIKGIFAEGTSDAIFRLYIDNVKVWQGRNQWTERNVHALMEFDADESLDVELRVVNLGNASDTFTGGFYAHENDA